MNGSAQDWEEDWRKGVNGKLDTLTSLVQGLVSRMSLNEQAITDLRGKPANLRDWAGVWLLVCGLIVSSLCGASGFVLALVQMLAAHWH